MARKGPMGTLLFAGRKKDVIKSGGYSVYSVEVQQTLEEHPKVAEAAVLGLPDERQGEIPVAAIRLKPGVQVEPDELTAFVRERLSGYKVPRKIVIVGEMPRTGTDKVQKAELLGLFEAI
jgi:acyl-CoA synthetase (AMP-forming)/AMP-acid ligase II